MYKVLAKRGGSHNNDTYVLWSLESHAVTEVSSNELRSLTEEHAIQDAYISRGDRVVGSGVRNVYVSSYPMPDSVIAFKNDDVLAADRVNRGDARFKCNRLEYTAMSEALDSVSINACYITGLAKTGKTTAAMCYLASKAVSDEETVYISLRATTSLNRIRELLKLPEFCTCTYVCIDNAYYISDLLINYDAFIGTLYDRKFLFVDCNAVTAKNGDCLVYDFSVLSYSDYITMFSDDMWSYIETVSLAGGNLGTRISDCPTLEALGSLVVSTVTDLFIKTYANDRILNSPEERDFICSELLTILFSSVISQFSELEFDPCDLYYVLESLFANHILDAGSGLSDTTIKTLISAAENILIANNCCRRYANTDDTVSVGSDFFVSIPWLAKALVDYYTHYLSVFYDYKKYNKFMYKTAVIANAVKYLSSKSSVTYYYEDSNKKHADLIVPHSSGTISVYTVTQSKKIKPKHFKGMNKPDVITAVCHRHKPAAYREYKAYVLYAGETNYAAGYININDFITHPDLYLSDSNVK
jgi:hypothetical protein